MGFEEGVVGLFLGVFVVEGCGGCEEMGGGGGDEGKRREGRRGRGEGERRRGRGGEGKREVEG